MKTIEEAATEFSDKYWKQLTDYEKISTFKAGVEFAQRWISVEEELPESGELVLVAIENCFTDVVCARIISGKWNCRLYIPTGHPDFIIEDKVTHWRTIELK